MAELVGIFLCAGQFDDDRLSITIEKYRYEYIDHVVSLITSVFGIEPTVSEHFEKTTIAITDEEVVQAFKKDALEMK